MERGLTTSKPGGGRSASRVPASWVSAWRYFAPQTTTTPTAPTHRGHQKNAAFQLRRPIFPRSGGEIASPRMWIAKMFKANAVARTDGCVTFARIALVGPVLKNRKNIAMKTMTQAHGNGA